MQEKNYTCDILSDDCRLLLKNANDIIDVNVMEDPHYRVAVDKI